MGLQPSTRVASTAKPVSLGVGGRGGCFCPACGSCECVCVCRRCHFLSHTYKSNVVLFQLTTLCMIFRSVDFQHFFIIFPFLSFHLLLFSPSCCTRDEMDCEGLRDPPSCPVSHHTINGDRGCCRASYSQRALRAKTRKTLGKRCTCTQAGVHGDANAQAGRSAAVEGAATAHHKVTRGTEWREEINCMRKE